MLFTKAPLTAILSVTKKHSFSDGIISMGSLLVRVELFMRVKEKGGAHSLPSSCLRNGDIINQPIIDGKRAVLLNKMAKFYWTFVPKRVREVIRLLWSM